VENSEYSPSFKQADTYPAVKVSWNDAQTFCAWLTKQELAAGKIKAAEVPFADGCGVERGGGTGQGVAPPKGAGNYTERLKVNNFEYTSPVGSFAANQHGLHDTGPYSFLSPATILNWLMPKKKIRRPPARHGQVERSACSWTPAGH
jgi:formylglycine-generating enzyme required for sulfatase activity